MHNYFILVNSLYSAYELEQQLRVVEKHKKLFGLDWYNRNMCQGLLYGIKDRPDKIALLMYTARRYGFFNVVRGVLARIAVRFRTNVKESSGADRNNAKRHVQ